MYSLDERPLAAALIAANDENEDDAYQAWIDSDEPREWAFGGDSLGGGYDANHWDTPSDVEDALREWTEGADYDGATKTCWVTDYAVALHPKTRERIRSTRVEVTTRIDPATPRCVDTRANDHVWDSPFELLGGLRENPGVHGHGGGAIIREVCSQCGTYKITNTWATDRSTGRQGLSSVEYVSPNKESLRWVRELQASGMLEALQGIVTPYFDDSNSGWIVDDYKLMKEDYESTDAWKQATQERLDEIREALPDGWSADWYGNDLMIWVRW